MDEGIILLFMKPMSSSGLLASDDDFDEAKVTQTWLKKC